MRPSKKINRENNSSNNYNNYKDNNDNSHNHSAKSLSRKRPHQEHSTKSNNKQSSPSSPSVTKAQPSSSKRTRTAAKSPPRSLQNEDDPDTRNVKRLENLLGIKRKRKRTASTKQSTSFSYKDVFEDGDDDLAELMDFCDNRSKRNVATTTTTHEANIVTANSNSRQNSEDHSPTVDTESEEDCQAPSDDHDDVDDDSGKADADSASISEEGDDSETEDGHTNQETNGVADEEGHDGNNEGGEVTAESPPVRSQKQRKKSQSQSPSNHAKLTSSSAVPQNSNCNKEQAKRDSSAGDKSRRYIPPGARSRAGASTDALKRRLRGLLNRVADVNAPGIAESVVDIFHQSNSGISRRELADIYANAAVDASRDGSGIGQVNPYVHSHAAIASHLGNRVDGIALATVIVVAVRRAVTALLESDGFHNSVAGSTEVEAETGGGSGNGDRGNDVFGYVALLCGLFARGGISSVLLYDMVRKVAENLNTLRLEVLLSMLREVGPLLRANDPVGLKGVIEFIQERASALEVEKDDDHNGGPKVSQIKLRVMLDLVNDIKNNRVRRSSLRDVEARFEWADAPDVPLNASVNDLLDDDFVSLRWWDDTKGLTVAEQRSNGNGNEQRKQSNDDDIQTPAAIILNEGPDLSTLAVSLRLNTEYRRAVFRAVMGAANLTDAVERLEALGAFDVKNGHDRDTALVILHCCAAERTFNPFYAVLAESFCQRARRLRFTFEFAMWDVFKTIPGASKDSDGKSGGRKAMPIRKRRHYANLLARLWKSNVLSFSVLRRMPVDVEDGMQIEEREFYIDAVVRALRLISKPSEEKKEKGKDHKEDQDKLSLFKKLVEETWVGSDDFRMSFASFLRRYVSMEVTDDAKAVMLKGADLLERPIE